MELSIDWTEVVSNLARLLIAYVMVLPVGWNRERRGTAGLNTFPLVAVATCGYMLIGIQVPAREREQFQRFLDELGYVYRDETDNPAFRMFLA